jgi:SAM-dependent methyltransferase
MSLDDAVTLMRERPEFATLVHNAYLGPDLADSARRFASSGEFAAVRAILGDKINGAHVLDLGAGIGMASAAFLGAGAAHVIAIEPDPSQIVGSGALCRLCEGLAVETRSDYAEQLSVESDHIDIVYARQVLHHTKNLSKAVSECARVLRHGGLFLACREHVVDNALQLQEFLLHHPVHQLAGGENAYAASEYLDAIAKAGLQLIQEIGPWDSVINAFPTVTNDLELAGYAEQLLVRKFGRMGGAIARVPGAKSIVWRWLNQRRPGRAHSYLAYKP